MRSGFFTRSTWQILRLSRYDDDIFNTIYATISYLLMRRVEELPIILGDVQRRFESSSSACFAVQDSVGRLLCSFCSFPMPHPFYLPNLIEQVDDIEYLWPYSALLFICFGPRSQWSCRLIATMLGKLALSRRRSLAASGSLDELLTSPLMSLEDIFSSSSLKPMS